VSEETQTQAPEVPAPEVVAKATEMGWSPKEKFRGDPEKWIPADEYVRRGEHLLPIVQASNRKLTAEMASMRSQLSDAQKALKDSTEAIEALKEFNSEQNRAALREQKSAIRKQIAEARKEGDTDLEVKLEENLDTVDDELKKADKKPDAKPAAVQPTQDQDWLAVPELKSWADENPWFGADRRKSAIAIAIANDIKQDPATSRLIGQAFLDKLDEELAATPGFAPAKPTQSKVGSGRPSGGGGSGAGDQSYAALPAEAKAACDKQASKLVGPNRAFKDQNAWRKHYAEQYFKE